MGKALLVLERLLHNCVCGLNLNETIARKKLEELLLNRDALNHHLISCMLKGYSVLSLHVILRDIYPGSLDQLDLILSLVPSSNLYKSSPQITASFAASIGALKVCLHSIYKHVLIDAFDKLVCGEIAGELSTYRQTLSPCELLNNFLSTYLELFGDMVLHLLVPLDLPPSVRNLSFMYVYVLIDLFDLFVAENKRKKNICLLLKKEKKEKELKNKR
jgi:hypothetical protein